MTRRSSTPTMRHAGGAWLEADHHATTRGAWLVTWRPRFGRVGLDYEAAVEEALCFGLGR